MNSQDNLQTNSRLELVIFTAEFTLSSQIIFITSAGVFTITVFLLLPLSLSLCLSLSLSLSLSLRWGRTQDRVSLRKCNVYVSCLRFVQRALDPTNQCGLGLREGEMLLGAYANCFAQALRVPEIRQ